MSNRYSIKKRVLVTGGAGFIGANYVRHHAKQNPGDTIVVLDALTYAGNRANLASLQGDARHSFVHGDICDRALVDNLLAKRPEDRYASAQQVETVLNQAALQAGLDTGNAAAL